MLTTTCPATATDADGLDDTALLERAADGDPTAWKRLLEEHGPLVRSVARSFRLQPADVADVVQATWLRLLQKGHTIRDPGRLAGWLAVVASHESLTLLRRGARQDLLPLDDTPDTGDDPATAVTNRAAAQQLWSVVAELRPRQQALLVALFRDEVDSYRDVAARCGVPIGSIGPTRARALALLQRKLVERQWERADL